MDRFGRLWAALPAMLLMGAGLHRARRSRTTSTARRCGSRCSPRCSASATGSRAASCSPSARMSRPRPTPRRSSARGARSPTRAARSRRCSSRRITAVSSLSIATGVVGVVALLGGARVRAVGAEVRAAGPTVTRRCSSAAAATTDAAAPASSATAGCIGIARSCGRMPEPTTRAARYDCPGSGSPGTAAPTLASGFPGGRRSVRTAWASSRSTRTAGWSRTTRGAPHPIAKQSSVRSGSTRTDGRVPRPTPRAESLFRESGSGTNLYLPLGSAYRVMSASPTRGRP